MLRLKHTVNVNDEKDKLINDLKKKLNKRNKKIKLLEERIRQKNQIIYMIKHSFTWRIGRFFLIACHARAGNYYTIPWQRVYVQVLNYGMFYLTLSLQGLLCEYVT